ncbi:SPFH domain / Band 7 family protein [Chishuiella changwenlii]|uniref:Peptidase n=1 Tax=Chishuiella changwenlii TaxID=1434701 RepID=A0A1M6YIE8_9FLAO|nr:slipin family protein [Chishuiella changwenlii]GGE97206.1 peptidase [Chishuiella changwenlii]SHL17759.1 SPFH domain / Band 7 family protein [Chishuiella changwenlii]
MKKLAINKQEIAIKIKNEEVTKVYTTGTYWIFSNKEIVKFNLNEVIDVKFHSMILENETLKSMVNIYEVIHNEVLVTFRNNQFDKSFVNRNVMIWKNSTQLTTVKYDLNSTEEVQKLDKREIEILKKISAIRTISIAPYFEGLLFKDNQFNSILKAGDYLFYSNEAKISIVTYDLRPQTIEILGQEILTKDKVQLRINFMVQYQITNLLKAYTSDKDFTKMIYQAIQLGLREFIGNIGFDELMSDKNSITKYIIEKFETQFETIGLKLKDAGMKDIILPGEIREIMNRVLIAEKTAQANSITRREETASTRSLLNTAKLMEENETLWKLKEMEYIEKIADKVGEISISGGSNVLNELKTMFTK